MVSKSPGNRRAGHSTVNAKTLLSPRSSSETTLDKFLGPAPLLEGEDPSAYNGLLDEVLRHVGPKDIVEQIYVRDIVDLTWELMRARRIKVSLLHKGQVRAVHQLAASNNWPGLDYDAKKNVSSAIAKGFSQAVSVLKKYGVSLGDVNAHAFASESDTLQLIDQNMIQVEARRNFTLREIEKRRASLAQRLGRAINEVEGDFKEVEPESSSLKSEKGL